MNGAAPFQRALRELRCLGGLGIDLVGARERLLERVQEAVEIDGDQLDRADRREIPAVGEPAGAEVPAALGRCAKIAVDLGRRAARLARRLDVVTKGLLARRVAIVPIAVEQRAVGKPHDAPMCDSRRERPGAFHPELVLAAQRAEELAVDGAAVARCEELDHQREEWRLRAAHVIAAIAVGYVPIAVDEPGEIPDHVQR